MPKFTVPTVKRTDDLRAHAFVHKWADHPDKPCCKTKLEVALLADVAALPAIKKNLHLLKDKVMSLPSVRSRCGVHALHLIRQKLKESDDLQTEWQKDFLDYNNGVYFVRGYKMVENDYLKLEITKARNAGQEYLVPMPTVEGSLKLMARLMYGVPLDFLLAPYMHRADYTGLMEFEEHVSSQV